MLRQALLASDFKTQFNRLWDDLQHFANSVVDTGFVDAASHFGSDFSKLFVNEIVGNEFKLNTYAHAVRQQLKYRTHAITQP